MIKYDDRLFKDYIELFLAMTNGEMEFNEKVFTHSRYFYIRALLQEKFPEKSYTTEEIEEIIDEELALKTITLKDEKGLLSASSYDSLHLFDVEPQDLLPEGYPLGDIDFRDLIDESLLKVISEKLYIQDTLQRIVFKYTLKRMELMLAANFVETEVREMLRKFKMTQYDEQILLALAVQIIKSYEDYRKLVNTP